MPPEFCRLQLSSYNILTSSHCSIHRRCSLAVERHTRNAKVPSSTLGSAFCQKGWQPLPPLLLFCSLPRFSLPAPFPSRGDLCTTRAYARPGFSGLLCFSTHAPGGVLPVSDGDRYRRGTSQPAPRLPLTSRRALCLRSFCSSRFVRRRRRHTYPSTALSSLPRLLQDLSPGRLLRRRSLVYDLFRFL